MDIAFEQKIRQRAYEIWVSAGMEDGDAESHWLDAERAMLDEIASPMAKPSAAAKSAGVEATKAARPRQSKAAGAAKPSPGVKTASAKIASANTAPAKASSAKKTATKAFAKARTVDGHAATMN